MKKHNYIIILGLLILYFVYTNTKSRYSKGKIIYINNNIIEKEEEEEIIEPRKHYDSRFYPRKRMAINVPTRGEPPSYQQVGYLTGEGEENIKPLFGRQTYRGSNQWNYFTSLDSHLATKVPVYMDNQDCTDERGCGELQKDESVSMGQDGNTYNASIYGNIAPRYIPY
jgi:hypothetical protein